MSPTIPVIVLFWMMIGHWFADFVLQTHWQATNKSTSNDALTQHVATYTVMMAGVSVCFVPISMWLFWVGINGALHWVTDYFTSRWSSKYFKKGDFHNGFVVVGVDQFIHLACLTLTTVYLR